MLDLIVVKICLEISILFSPFQALCEWIAPHLPAVHTVTIEKMLPTLWLFSIKESYRGVADHFGVDKGE